MKIAVLTAQKRVEKYYDLSTLPKDFSLVYLPLGATNEQVLQKARDAEVIFADAIAPVDAQLIANMPHLKLIHSEGVAYNAIDLKAADARGIYVCNNAGANACSVAEHTLLLMLSVLRRLCEGDQMVRCGRQIEAKQGFILHGIHELSSCKVGLIGFGAIAKETARLLHAFGAQVFYFSRTRAQSQTEQAFGVQYLPLEHLLKTCNIISLHLPVTAQTTHMANAAFFAAMQKGSILINTARGEIVDQQALCQALESGHLAGAGLDTLSPEPVTQDNPLLNLSPQASLRVTFSPHIGGTTDDAFRRMHAMVWQNILRLQNGQTPQNVVNHPR